MAKGDITSDRLLAGLPVEGNAIRLGNCLVFSKLGGGGMGAVYLGRDVKLNVPVAVKIIPFHLVESNPDLVKRFSREAQAAAQVDHPSLIRVYTVDEEKGVNYLVMEFVDGESGAERLKREGPLPEADALDICIATGEALASAHAKGTIHRDIKPANIMIRHEDGRVKLADLGLAKSFQEESTKAGGLTATGQVMGTPAYMSPEQARDASQVDPRTDIYSLGATLYALLAGRAPHDATQLLALLQKVATEEPDEPKRIRPELTDATCDVIKRMMAKKPGDRVATMTGAVALMKQAREALGVSKGLARPQLAGTHAAELAAAPASAAPTAPAAAEAGRTLEDVTPADVAAKRTRDASTVSVAPGLRAWKIAAVAGSVAAAAIVVGVVVVLATRGEEEAPSPIDERVDVEAEQRKREADAVAYKAALDSVAEAVDKDDWKAASAACRAYIEKFPDGAFVEELKARLSEIDRSAVVPEAEAILKSGIEFQSMTARDLFAEAEECLRAEEYSKARDLLRDVAAEAKSPEAKKKVGTLAVYAYIQELILLRKAGEWRKFAALAAKAARTHPQSKRLARMAELGARQDVSPAARKAFERARELEQAGKHMEAASAYEAALPELNEYYRKLAREGIARSKETAFKEFYEAAKRAEKEERWVQVIDAIEGAEEIKPGNRFLTRLAGEVGPKAAAELVRQADGHVAGGRWKEARAALARATELGVGPDDQPASMKVADALSRRDRYDAHLKAAMDAMKKRNWEAAARELEGARALFPKERAVADLLAQVEAGPDDDAFKAAQQAVSAAKDDWDRGAAAYDDYLKRFSEGKHVQAARRGIQELRAREDDAAFSSARKAAAGAKGDWERAVAAYESYLKNFARGRHLAEARAAIAGANKKALDAAASADDGAFKAARAAAAKAEDDWAGAAAAYEGYLKEFSKGRHAEEARRGIERCRAREDDSTFESARRVATEAGKNRARATAAYKIYLQRHPEGRHAQEAQKLLAEIRAQAEDEFFRAVEKKADEAKAGGKWARVIAAYQIYTKKHRQGRHAAEAQLAIAEAREMLEAGGTDVSAIDEELARIEEPTVAVEEPAAVEEKELAVDLGGGVTLAMAWILPGRFLMGDASGEEDEKLVHEVTLTQGFFMGKTEITNAQWKAVTGKRRRLSRAYAGASQPVVDVSWREAVTFAKKLSESAGARFRLPTEAEWEYAARAGSRTRYFFGDEPDTLGDYAWYSKNARKKTRPVGQKEPNAWGLYDMFGNVWEWCADCYDGEYYASGQMRDPKGPAEGAERVRRGGCFGLDAACVRSAYRGAKKPGIRSFAMGFRVVREQ